VEQLLANIVKITQSATKGFITKTGINPQETRSKRSNLRGRFGVADILFNGFLHPA